MFNEVIKSLKDSIKDVYCMQVNWDKNNLTSSQKLILEKMAILLFKFDGDAQKAIENLDSSVTLSDLIIIKNQENEK